MAFFIKVMDEILKLADKVYRGRLTSKDKSLIHAAYKRYTGTIIGSCDSCFIKEFEYLKNIKNPIMKTDDRKFRLHPGKLITNMRLGMDYSDANITDAAALKILKMNPGTIKFFKVYPANWQELIATQGAAQAITPVENKVASKIEETPAPISTQGVFESKSLEDLKAFAKESMYPKKEWKNLGKSELIEYLVSKTK